MSSDKNRSEDNHNEAMIVCDNLVKIYKTGETEVMALQGLDLTINHGEVVAIIGASGSGKTTLLNMIGCLDTPTLGKLMVDGHDLLKMSKTALTTYKRSVVGFVWQNNARNLIPYLTAYENVELVRRIGGTKDKKYVKELLELVGLGHRMKSKLAEMSSGEQQRVAVSIALVNKPKLILADEPTGAVDTKTAEGIMKMFDDLRNTLGVTIVVVSHDVNIAGFVDRVVAIRDGKTSSEILRSENITAMADLTSFKDKHVELAVIDRSGRVQIPADYLERLGTGKSNRVRVDLEDGRIVIHPVDV